MAKRGKSAEEEKSIFERWGMQEWATGTRLSCHEQFEKIEKDMMHRSPAFIRKCLVQGLGLRTSPAENVIITGCSWFYQPTQIVALSKLLDRLGIEHAYLNDAEYCCGGNLFEQAKPSQYEAMRADAGKIIGLNVAQARALGAKRILHYCYVCIGMYTRFAPTPDIEQVYYLDPLGEKLERETLRVKPTVIGYYEGCWQRPREVNPDINIGLAEYRKWLGRVEGLKVVELQHSKCCVTNAAEILDRAQKNRVDYIVTPCSGCVYWINAAAKGSVPVKLLHELLLEAVTPQDKVQ